MSRNGAPSTNPDRGWGLLVAALVVLCAVVGLVWVAVDAGYGAAHQAPPGNPAQLVADLLTGARPWPGGMSTLVAAGTLVLLLVLVGVGAVVWVRRPRRTRVDAMARRLAPHSQLTGVTPADVARTAARLRPGETLNGPDDHGLPIGKTVPGAVTIRQGWEDCSVLVAGPRTGKTTAAAIPAVTAAPGAVAVTSNKADVHDATRGVRAGKGTVWLFDPQGIADTSRVATWWWNPLTPVTSLAPAKGLAAHFVSNSRDASARTDAYFDGGAQGLLATYLLAASLGGGDVLHVLEWLYDDTDLTPARLLAAHGNPMAAARVMATTNLRPAQKDGLYDGARRFLEVLDEPAYAGWVTPPRRRVFTQLGDELEVTEAEATHDAPEFSPTTFAASTDTLYALSMEGPESASALTTALIGQVFEAASHLAATLPGRRLGTPLTVVLDEAANVCKLAELPNLYSHFGSRGIVVMTIFQSAVQGYEVWGENGFRKLWSAANLKMYGGGVSDEPWLRELSNLIGVHDVSRWSQSTGRGGASRSQSWSSEPILDVAELMGLPRGRAVLLSSGNKAAMLRLVPWMGGPHAVAVQASLLRWEPADRRAERLRAAHEFSADASPAEEDGGGVLAAKQAPRGRNPLLPPAG